jgi:DNA-binding IclR family transcriptional regulator
MPRDGTFTKIMTVVRCVAEHAEGVRFPELLDRLELPKSTLHRILQSLQAERLLCFDEQGRRYRLGYGLLELARQSWERTDIRREAQHVMAELMAQTSETVHLAVLDGPDVVYVDKVESPQTMRMGSAVGARNPAYCTGVGKALLAFVEPRELARRLDGYKFHAFTPNTIVSEKRLVEELNRIRTTLVAVDNEEHEIGVRCAAAPIFNYQGMAIASISVAVPTFRWNPRRFRLLMDRVRLAAASITTSCGGIAPRNPTVQAPRH